MLSTLPTPVLALDRLRRADVDAVSTTPTIAVTSDLLQLAVADADVVADSSLLAWLAAITAARHRINAAKAAAVRCKVRRSGLSWGIDRVHLTPAYHFN